MNNIDNYLPILPKDVLHSIISPKKLLSARDILNFCLTCRDIYKKIIGNSFWWTVLLKSVTTITKSLTNHVKKYNLSLLAFKKLTSEKLKTEFRSFFFEEKIVDSDDKIIIEKKMH